MKIQAICGGRRRQYGFEEGLRRRGFDRFVEKSGLRGSMPGIVASGSRGNAYKDYLVRDIAIQPITHEITLLLVDAEAAVQESIAVGTPKGYFDGWDRPVGATDEQWHLMLQAMETWFLADRASLGQFYGQCFQENALPSNPQIERVANSDCRQRS